MKFSKGENIDLVDLKICQIIYVVIHSFFKYLVCNIRPLG